MKDLDRTIILLTIIFIAVVYIIWTNQTIETNFVDTLR
jgi:hypothetical protein